MRPSPDYPRRRFVVAAIAVLILCAGHEPHRPVIGTLSITMDDATHVPQVSGEWAPPLALAAAVVTKGAAFVAECLAR